MPEPQDRPSPNTAYTSLRSIKAYGMHTPLTAPLVAPLATSATGSPASGAAATPSSLLAPPTRPTPKRESSVRKSRLTERMAVLGIPENEMTPSVTLAVSALMEKVDTLQYELQRTRESLTEMERLVDVDCIAPVPNRRAFMRRLSWAIAMHERYDHPSSVLYFDVNEFKSINDTHGHAAGDAAIKHISRLLLDSMRESDFLARIGGDEFAIIMYYASTDDAEKRGAMIAEKIRRTPLVWNGRSITMTIAEGCYSIKKGDDAETALGAADMAMYIDKKRSKAALINTKA